MMRESCRTLQERGGWWEDVLVKRCSFPIAPINTFTNLAYVVAGICLYLAMPSAPSLVVASALVLLGIFSGLYHGFKTIWSSRLDHVGMYSVFLTIAIYSISPTHGFIAPLMALGALGVSIPLTYGPNWKRVLNSILGVLIGISLLAGMLNGKPAFSSLSLGVFILAYTIWQLDKHRIFWIKKWGHGIWHILTPIALVLLYMGIR